MGNDNEQKQGLGKLLKEAGKNKKKEVLKKVLIAAAPYIGLILLGLILISCMISFVGIIKDNVQNTINSIVDFFKGTDTAIEIDDKKLDELIAMIEETGIDLEDLELLR